MTPTCGSGRHPYPFRKGKPVTKQQKREDIARNSNELATEVPKKQVNLFDEDTDERSDTELEYVTT